MAHHLAMLQGFQALFASHGEAGRDAFHRHYQALNAEQTYPALWAVHYAPLVSEGERDAFEAQVQADRSLHEQGYTGFHIRPAEPARTQYVPVTYVEPAGRMDSMLGQDLLDEAARRQAVMRARDAGQIQSTPPLQIRGLPAGTSGLAVRLPLYSGGRQPDTLEGRRTHFQGVVTGVLLTRMLMTQLGGNRDWRRLHWRADDLGPLDGTPDHDSADVTPVLFDTATFGGTAWTGPDPARPADRADRIEHHTDMAGRRWQLSFTRPPRTPAGSALSDGLAAGRRGRLGGAVVGVAQPGAARLAGCAARR